MSKPHHTLADYVVIALSPVLIMALVGSLVFFLLEILYVGQYYERLQWTLFFYVFGAVLIGRMALQTEIAHRAGLYTLVLGGLTWVSLQTFVEYPPEGPLPQFRALINLGLIVLIWWCAKRLTWDCTHIDDEVDASGKGVLESAGLDSPAPTSKETPPKPEQIEEKKRGKKKEPTGLAGWWDRYQRYQEEQKTRPHTPGVWVVYFSLAALPLFGLGQALVREESRRYTFWLMVIYVGSGLGLLLTTAFLGLRRYLRQRQLQMPMAMTSLWLSAGGVLIVLLLVAGALMPRPSAEYSLVDITPLGSEEQDASSRSFLNDNEGKAGDKSASGKPKPGGQVPSKSGNQGSKSGDQQGKQPGSGERKDKSSGDKNNASGDKSDKPGDKKPGDENRDKSNGGKPEEKSGEKSGGRPGDDKSDQKRAAESRNRTSSSSRKPSTDFLSSLGTVGTVLKWIVFAIFGLVVAFLVVRALLQFMANFTSWADRLLKAWQAWWASLFGWWNRRGGTATAAEAGATMAPQPRPFASYANPFLDGRSQRLPPEELVRYTFEALQAWAAERGLRRQPEETPLEFAERLGLEVAALEEDLRRLAGLYVRAAYASGTLPASCQGFLQQFWQRLEAAVERPLSA